MSREKFKEDEAGVQGASEEILGLPHLGLGHFAASSGNVTDEVIEEYIKNPEVEKDDDDLSMEE